MVGGGDNMKGGLCLGGGWVGLVLREAVGRGQENRT